MPPQRNTPSHSDPGLQPERTDLAWGRTTLSLVAVAAAFLRWMPHHGWFVSTLAAAATLTAMAMGINRKRRFHRAIQAVNQETMHPDIASTAIVAAAVVTLTGLGIYVALFLPMR